MEENQINDIEIKENKQLSDCNADSVQNDADGETLTRSVDTVFEWIDSFVIALVIVALMFALVIGKVEVSGKSMKNTLENADQLIISGWNYVPQKSDIVILASNCSKTELGKVVTSKPLVKRIIATEGDYVEIKDKCVYVNGKKQTEPYAVGNTYTNGFEGKQRVPKNCVFVLGDNREDSADSRMIGFIDKNYILGKVLFRLFPLNSVATFN